MADNIDSRISQFVFAETERAVKKEINLSKQISSVEELVGGKSVTNSIEGYIVNDITSTGNKVPTAQAVKSGIEGYIVDNLNTSGNKVPTAETVKKAIDDNTYSTESNDNQYSNHLATITDSKGNVLAYFDGNGNFHVNGAIISTNI